MVTRKEIIESMVKMGYYFDDSIIMRIRLLQGKVPITIVLDNLDGTQSRVTSYDPNRVSYDLLDVINKDNRWVPYPDSHILISHHEEILENEKDDFHRVIRRTHRLTGESYDVYCTLQKNGEWVVTPKLNNYFRKILGMGKYKTDSHEYTLQYYSKIHKPEVDLEKRIVYVPSGKLDNDKKAITQSHYYKSKGVILVCHAFCGDKDRNRVEAYKINVAKNTGRIYFTRPNYSHPEWMDLFSGLEKAAVNPATHPKIRDLLTGYASLEYLYEGDKVILTSDKQFYVNMNGIWFEIDPEVQYYKENLPESMQQEIAMAKNFSM